MALSTSARSQPVGAARSCHQQRLTACRASVGGGNGPVAAAPAAASRRGWLAAGAATGLASLLQPAWLPARTLAEEAAPPSSSSGGGGLEILAEEQGSGTAAARAGDLVLFHYSGSLAHDGTLFDSTRGGQAYRDGGLGVLRPVAIRLGGPPVPGICDGLQRGIEGMRVGGRRTLLVPPSQGFGTAAVAGPYGVVPGGSTLRYEVELLRLSRLGPDALMSGIAQCGGGAAMERTAGCVEIPPAEFV